MARGRCANCGHDADAHDDFGCCEVTGWGGESGNVKTCKCSHYSPSRWPQRTV